MANLNSDWLGKKREEYLANAKSIKEILVDDTGDENYGDVPEGYYPESVSTVSAVQPPIDDTAPSMMRSGNDFMGMRPTDIRAMQAAQMSEAEKDFYLVKNDVVLDAGVTVNGDVNEYDTEYIDDDNDDDDKYESYGNDDFDDDYDNDEFNAPNEMSTDIDFDDDDDDDDDDSDDSDEDYAEYLVIDEEGDIDDDDAFDDINDYNDEELEDLDEIVALLKSMGIDSFEDDFDDDVIMIASYDRRQPHFNRKDITGTIPVTPASRPTDSDSTAAVDIERKPKRSGESGNTNQRSGKSNSKVYGLLFK